MDKYERHSKLFNHFLDKEQEAIEAKEPVDYLFSLINKLLDTIVKEYALEDLELLDCHNGYLVHCVEHYKKGTLIF